MKRFTESVWFQYLAVVLSILLVFNLIPPTAFRTYADTPGNSVTIRLLYEKDGTNYTPQVSGTLTLIETANPGNTLNGNVTNGVAVVEGVLWDTEYRIEVTLSGTSDYVLDSAQNIFVESTGVKDSITFNDIENETTIVLNAAGTTSAHGYVSGSMPEDSTQIQVTEINGFTLTNPITTMASGTDNEYTLTGLPDIAGSTMKVTYSSEGFDTVTNTIGIPSAGQDIDTVT